MLPIIRFYSLYLFAVQVGFSLLMLFARQAGLSMTELTLYGAPLYLTPVALIPLIRQLPTRRSFTLTITLAILSLTFMWRIHSSVWWYWAIAPVIGSTMVTFWVVYLTRHVTAGPDRANAYNSSVIVFIMFGVACISPLVAGQLGQRFGPHAVIATSAVLLLVALTQVRSIKPRIITVRLLAVWPKVPAYARRLLLLQGMYEALQFLILPICTTAYFKDPMPFGAFFGVVAFVGSATNLLISRWSDRVGNRSRMIYVGCALMGVGAVGLAMADRVPQWAAFALCIQTGFTFTLPYFMAVILDAVPDIDDAFVVREWGLNVGRVVTIAVCLMLLRVTGNLQHAYFWGLVPLVGYPALLYRAQRRGFAVLPALPPEITSATTADAQAAPSSTS